MLFLCVSVLYVRGWLCVNIAVSLDFIIGLFTLASDFRAWLCKSERQADSWADKISNIDYFIEQLTPQI